MLTIARKFVFSALFLSLLASSSGQTASVKGESRTLTTAESNAGSVVTTLPYGIQLNTGSSLQRRRFVVNDDSCPMQLKEAGISTGFKSSSIGGDFTYLPVGSATFREAITAFDVRFLLFDLWGEHVKTLQASKIADMRGEIVLKDIGSWRAWENEVSELFTVVSFVARVRKPDGTIWQYDAGGLLKQVENIKVKLTDKELAPEREKPKN